MFKFEGVAKSYKSACKGPDQDRWMRAADEEFDRLIETTETMKFVPWNTKPKERKASYYNLRSGSRPRAMGPLSTVCVGPMEVISLTTKGPQLRRQRI
jgi:hypothetical protein